MRLAEGETANRRRARERLHRDGFRLGRAVCSPPDAAAVFCIRAEVARTFCSERSVGACRTVLLNSVAPLEPDGPVKNCYRVIQNLITDYQDVDAESHFLIQDFPAHAQKLIGFIRYRQ